MQGIAESSSMSQRLSLARTYYRFMKKQHATPSTWWYAANTAVQVRARLLVYVPWHTRAVCLE